jgi:hypothetical protein
MTEIREAIDSADTYVVVLSPSSVRSKICAAELDQALQANKRIVKGSTIRITPPSDTGGSDRRARLFVRSSFGESPGPGVF